MAPFYQEICSDLKWEFDETLATTFQKTCDEKVVALDAKIEEAEKSLGETEIREAMLEKSEHYAIIGDKVCTGNNLMRWHVHPAIATIKVHPKALK
jgi:26S proteasome regulatory subunit N7